MEFSIGKCAMLIILNRKKASNEWKGTAQWRKNLNAWRKLKFKVLGDIGRGHHQTSGNERKKKTTTDEQENSSKAGSAAGTLLQKGTLQLSRLWAKASSFHWTKWFNDSIVHWPPHSLNTDNKITLCQTCPVGEMVKYLQVLWITKKEWNNHNIRKGWNDKIVILKKATLQLYFKTFIEKINSGNLIM